MSIKNSIIVFSILFTMSCHSEKESSTDSRYNDDIESEKEPLRASKYLRWIDDIEFDPAVDEDEFKVCQGDEQVIQYFNNSQGVEYEGEKPAIDKAFQENYDATKAVKESGLIRIRFIVNCEGETGRFRVLSMDEAYNEKPPDASITDQLLEITKRLKGWKPKVDRGRKVDYYQYLIFKIQDGEIVKMLP